MADRLKRAAAWLGLVTDDRYSEYDEPGHDEPTTGVPTSADREDSKVTHLETKRPVAATSGSPAAAPVSPAPKPTPAPAPRSSDISRIITVHPRTYNEARTIGEHFRDGVPVIMNLTEMEDTDAKRLVDFSAGLIFGLRGSIDRVTSKVFLLSPPNVNVTAEDKERIAGGFFNQS